MNYLSTAEKASKDEHFYKVLQNCCQILVELGRQLCALWVSPQILSLLYFMYLLCSDVKRRWLNAKVTVSNAFRLPYKDFLLVMIKLTASDSIQTIIEKS